MSHPKVNQSNQRQQKITKAFEKQTQHSDNDDEELDGLYADIKKYSERLDNLELYLFQLQKKSLPQPKPFHAKNETAIREGIASMGSKINMTHKHMELKTFLAETLKDFGLAIDLFNDKICTIKFDVTINKRHVADYAVQLIHKDDDNWELKKYHLPLCFNLDTLASRAEPMTVEYFGLMQDGLYAYHERLMQRDELQDSVPNHVTILPIVNGTVVEIIFKMADQESYDSETLDVVLTVTYDPFMSRPCQFEISQNIVMDTQNNQTIVMKEQFSPLMSYRLSEAFFRSVGKSKDNKFYCPTDEEYADIIAARCRRQPSAVTNYYDNGNQEESDSDPGSVFTHNMDVQRQHRPQRHPVASQNQIDQSDSGGEMEFLQKMQPTGKLPRGRTASSKVIKRPTTRRSSFTDQSSEENVRPTVRKMVQRESKKDASENRMENNQENRHCNEQNDVYAESQVYDPMEDESFIRRTSRVKKAPLKTVVGNTRKQQKNMTASFASSDDQNSSVIRRTARVRKVKQNYSINVRRVNSTDKSKKRSRPKLEIIAS